MSKYRVLWIDDKCEEMFAFVKNWRLDPEKDIELVGYKFAQDGLRALDAVPQQWDAIILDVQMKISNENEGTSIEGFGLCVDHIKKYHDAIPYFILTGESKYKSDEEFAKLQRQRIYKKGNEQDELDLVQAIHHAAQAKVESRVKKKYAKELEFCSKHVQTIIDVASCIENGDLKKTSVFNDMRDVLEWVTKYGREHGLFTDEVATPALAKTFIEQIKDPDIVPSYVVATFVACNEIVQNGSHGSDAGKAIKVKQHVKEGIAPNLITATFNNLMVILDWFSTLPTKLDEINILREITGAIKLKTEPLVGVVAKDEDNHFYCEEQEGERLCAILDTIARDQELEGKRVKIYSMVANKHYPDNSPYPYFTNRNIEII